MNGQSPLMVSHKKVTWVSSLTHNVNICFAPNDVHLVHTRPGSQPLVFHYHAIHVEIYALSYNKPRLVRFLNAMVVWFYVRLIYS